MKNILKDVHSLYHSKKSLIVFLLLFGAVMALDSIVTPHYLGIFTDYMASFQYTEVPIILLQWGLLLIVINLGSLLFQYFASRIRQETNKDLKEMVFLQAYLPGNEIVNNNEYITSILQDVKQIETSFVNSFISFIYCVLQGLLALAFVLNVNLQVGLVFILLGFIPTMIPKLTEKWLQTSTNNWQIQNRLYTQVMEDGLHGKQLIKRFNASKLMYSRVQNKLIEEQKAYFSMDFRQKTSSFLVGLLYNITVILSLAYGAFVVINGSLSIGELITVYMAADRVVSPLISLATMVASHPLLDKILNPNPIRNRISPPSFTKQDALIEFNNASIGYGNKLLSSNINLQINHGDRVLIQGPSGSGKSTLIKALLNEIEVLKGQILYNESLRDGNLYNHFALVEQKPFIFQDTLRFNLTLGQAIDDDLILKVLNEVGLEKLASVSELDNVISSENNQLSGGETKRLEVARSLLYNKKVLIVDEALSGLDNDRAKQLNELIVNYPGTVINIEHHIDDTIRSKYNKQYSIQN